MYILSKEGLAIFKSKKYNLLMLLLLIIMGIITTFFLTDLREAETDEIFLTVEEKLWLDLHKNDIKIGYTTDYPPVEYLSNGNYVGISADYFSLLEKKLGIQIQMVEFDNFEALMECAKNREISGITAATKTPARSEFLDFTIPYIENPNVIITRKNFSEDLTFEKLEYTSMDIVVAEGYDIIEILDDKFPKLDYRTVKSPREGMRMVSFGEADAMIIEVMTASAVIESDNISNLIVNIDTPYDSNLSIATRSDWPMMSKIFNKGIAQITDNERKAIERKWMPIQREGIFQNMYFWLSLLGFIGSLIFIIIAILIWNSSLKKAVEEKTRALEESTKELMYKTYHDELTGLYNRLYMNVLLKKFENEDYLPFSIVVADLNGLKITNDTFGHVVGDQMIINISDIIKNKIKETHFACRIGGDEIVIFMPRTDEDDCLEIVESIKVETFEAKEEPIKPLVALGSMTTYENISDSFNKIFKLAEDKMYANKVANSENTYDMIINSIKKNLHENKYESEIHYERLALLCRKFGEYLDLDHQDMDNLALLSKLHDIGKVGLEKDILLKEGPLNQEEWQKVKRHPEIGFKIVSASTKLSQIGKGILAHHERWDGSGYPQGLKKEEIPFIARVFSVVEAYEVMTHERPYKPTYSQEKAIKELQDCSGTQFDPRIVELFVNHIT